MNIAHPLVSAAVEYAKSWSGGSVELSLPPDAGPELTALTGQTGVLGIARIDYDGFEPVQRLVAGAIVNGAPIDPVLPAVSHGCKRATVRCWTCQATLSCSLI